MGSSTVISSVTTASLYHSGTAAFGSLIIAIVEFIRAIIMYLQKKVCWALGAAALDVDLGTGVRGWD